MRPKRSVEITRLPGEHLVIHAIRGSGRAHDPDISLAVAQVEARVAARSFDDRGLKRVGIDAVDTDSFGTTGHPRVAAPRLWNVRTLHQHRAPARWKPVDDVAVILTVSGVIERTALTQLLHSRTVGVDRDQPAERQEQARLVSDSCVSADKPLLGGKRAPTKLLGSFPAPEKRLGVPGLNVRDERHRLTAWCRSDIGNLITAWRQVDADGAWAKAEQCGIQILRSDLPIGTAGPRHGHRRSEQRIELRRH